MNDVPFLARIYIYSNVLSHFPPGTQHSFIQHPLCARDYVSILWANLRRLSAVLTVWFGFPIASISGYYTGRVCATLFGYCMFTYVLLVGPLMGRVIPSSPFKEHSVWHHNSCLVMFTDELKEGLVPVFGENV